MAADRVPADLRKRYEDAGQGHVFAFIDRDQLLDSDALIAQLAAIDPADATAHFQRAMTLLERAKAAGGLAAHDLKPLTDDPGSVAAGTVSGFVRRESQDPLLRSQWKAVGLQEIASGRSAHVLLAGGQASRLGVTCTKGAFDGGWPLHESLLEVFIERVVRLKDLAAAATGMSAADVHLPLYIMTSSANDVATRSFLEHNRFFGLPASDVFIFSQGSLPAFDMEGRFLMKTASEVMTAPDGNGGLFPALHTSGALADMHVRGVASVQVSTVDNILAKIADPIFTGACLAAGALVGSKVVRKTDPTEKVGCLAIANGRYCPVEYSELPPALAAQTDDATGRLRFDAGNVCIHWYSVAWLDSVAPGRWTPVYHGARKAIAHVDVATGAEVAGDVTKPEGSGWKLESFMFDAFPDRVPLGTMLTLEVAREQEFAPIKNASGAGADDPRTARALLTALHRQWLEAAGATVLGSGRVEVSPLVTYEGEGLEQLAGMTLHAPLVIMPGTRLAQTVAPAASPASPAAAGAPAAGTAAMITPSGVAAETSLELDAAGDVVHHYRVSTQVEIHKIVPTVPAVGVAAADSGAAGGATAAAGGAA